MFKQQGGFWWYFVGIIVMFLILFYLAQLVTGKATLGFGTKTSPVATKAVSTTTAGKTASPTNTRSSNNIDLSKDYYAEIITSTGTIKIELYEKNTPNTVANFINLANSGYYNGSKFYKLVPGIEVQGGSKDNSITGNPGYTIPDETNWDSLDYNEDLRVELRAGGYTSAKKIASIDIERYVLVMANPKPNSAGSQFIILLAGQDNPQIQTMRGKVTVFGKVIEDLTVIQKISALQVDNSGAFPKPKDDIVVNEVKIYIK